MVRTKGTSRYILKSCRSHHLHRREWRQTSVYLCAVCAILKLNCLGAAVPAAALSPIADGYLNVTGSIRPTSDTSRWKLGAARKRPALRLGLCIALALLRHGFKSRMFADCERFQASAQAVMGLLNGFF